MKAETIKKVKSNKIEIYKMKSQASLSGQFKRSDKLALKKEIARELTKLNQSKRKG